MTAIATTVQPETSLILREEPADTLEDVLHAWHRNRSYWGGGLHNVSVHLEDDEPTLVFGEHEIKSTDLGLEALARFIGIPVNYLLKVPADEKQWMLERRIERSGEQDMAVWFTSAGVEEVLPAGKRRIEPAQIVEAVSNVMPLDSHVRDAWHNPSDLRLDVFAPLGWDTGWGGDRKVGDLTAGGVRVTQNRKQNLAPGVQTFLYRLRCTNGQEVMDPSIKVDARGMDVEEVLAAFEIECDRAFRRAESDIAAFYDMRSQRVGSDRTGVLRRVSLDAGLPHRVTGLLEDLLPSQQSVSLDDLSMFDLANIISNHANLAPSSGSARNLQLASGSMINDHSARCNACHQRVQ